MLSSPCALAEIKDHQFPGHWEGDLVKGEANASAVGTLVERTSRLVVLVKLPEFKPASAANVMQAFSDNLLGIAQPMRFSMTFDQGREMAMHKELSKRTGLLCTSATRTALGSKAPREHERLGAPVPAQGHKPQRLQPGST